MPQDDETHAGADDNHSDARLARIERSIAELSARLRAVEQHLGVAARDEQREPDARPFGQGATRGYAANGPNDPRSAVAGERAAEPVSDAASEPSLMGASAEEATRKLAGAGAKQDAGAKQGAGAKTNEEAARDESAAVEDYPFHIPPRPVDAAREGRSFPASEFDAAHAASRATTAAAGATHRSGARAAAGARGSATSERAASGADSPSSSRPKRDLETLIGGSLFSWVAIVALVFGTGFFLKTAFENGWIGPAARVLLGGAAGCALLAVAERLRARGYRPYAYVLTGGGVLILYLSIYAARVFYDLVGVASAFALMSVVTATAVLLSVRHDARSIAVLALIGGFLTPALLSTGVDQQIALFTYVAFLDAGVLAVAYFKRWRVLDHLAFVATALVFAGWAASYYEPWKDWRTVFFLTLFFLMFAALALVHNVLRERRASWLDISLALTNAALYFASVYAVLEAGHRSLLGAFALFLAVFYLLLYAVARARHRADRLLASAYVVASVTLTTVAIGVQFKQHWMTIGWATEAFMLTWLGLRERERAARYSALAVFICAAERWLVYDLVGAAFDERASFTPLLNARTLSCAAIVAALAGVVHLYRRHAEGVDREERDLIAGVLILVANALALAALTADVDDYIRLRARDNSSAAAADTRLCAFTVLWSLYTAGALAVGVLRRLKPLRFAALAALAFVVVKLVAFDASSYDAAWHAPLLNQTFVAFAVVVGALVFGARLYARADWMGERERESVLHLLAGAANLLAVAGLSLEVLGDFDRAQALAGPSPVAEPLEWVNRLENTKQMALTFVWTIYGCAAFTFGIRRGRAHLRFGALLLLALSACKVLALDAHFYDAAWHAPLLNQTFAAFAAIVLSAWYVARLYARAENVDGGERGKALTILSVVGNLFAVAALSFEASGYFRKQLDERERAGLSARELRLARQLSLSLVWAIYGGAMLAFGHVRQNRTLRLLALALLAATTLKVFFFDLAELEKFYRIVSFVALGLVLLAVSFLYQQRQRRAREAEG